MKKIFLLSTIYFLLLTTAFAQSVDLLWQGDTYTPPFYQGRSLWSTQSDITFVAIPQGLGNPANLNYKWTKNGSVLGSFSGVGRNTLSFSDSILSITQTIRVDIISTTNIDILSDENPVMASASITLTPTSPSLNIYESSPLYGFMFHKSVGNNYQLKEKEITFTAFPYFFSVNTRLDNSLAYEWRTNTGGLETRDSVTYRVPDNTSGGSSQVSLRAFHKNQITQDARKSFLVEFGP